jgi:hypothetical protein
MIHILFPQPRAVFQRNAANQALIPISGVIHFQNVKPYYDLFARYEKVNDEKNKGSWVRISPAAKFFQGTITVPAGGWYRIMLQLRNGKKILGQTAVEKIGVGEIFIISGQSNSANHGSAKTVLQSDLGSAWTPKGWKHADDPQPLATGMSGSPWPSMMDILIQKLQVPIGLLSIGVGGTAVKQWLPEEALFERFRYILPFVKVLGGARAVLWHQGESDVSNKTSTEDYQAQLQTVIDATRTESGMNLNWMIAKVSYTLDVTPADYDRIAQAQLGICDNSSIFPGPTTDDLLGDDYRPDRIHFSPKGLKEHGSRWANCIMSTFFPTV